MATTAAGATTVSERLRELREERGINQSELHRRSGVARQTIINVETGAFEPSLGTLRRLAKALDVPLMELLDEDV